MNKRIWVVHKGSPVRLRLKPSCAVSFGSYARTDEGWESEGTKIVLCDDHVHMKCYFDGVDCDGRLSGEASQISRLDMLEVRSLDWHPLVRFPYWQKADEFRRDHQAEAAGY